MKHQTRNLLNSSWWQASLRYMQARWSQRRQMDYHRTEKACSYKRASRCVERVRWRAAASRNALSKTWRLRKWKITSSREHTFQKRLSLCKLANAARASNSFLRLQGSSDSRRLDSAIESIQETILPRDGLVEREGTGIQRCFTRLNQTRMREYWRKKGLCQSDLARCCDIYRLKTVTLWWLM